MIGADARSAPTKPVGAAGSGAAAWTQLLARWDPFTLPSERLRAEYAQSRRSIGTVMIVAVVCFVLIQWSIALAADAERADTPIPTTVASSADARAATFRPNSRLLVGGEAVLYTTFVPNAADLRAPCASNLTAALRAAAAAGTVNATIPLCPFTAGRVLHAPSTDAGGVAILMQLALPCPPLASVLDDAYTNGVQFSDLLAHSGLPPDTVLGHLEYGASTVPLYAWDVQTRVCKPPAALASVSYLPPDGRLADTSRVPLVSVQLQPRATRWPNGSTTHDVAVTSVRALEDDVWDPTGGDATTVVAPPATPSDYYATFPSLPRLARLGAWAAVAYAFNWERSPLPNGTERATVTPLTVPTLQANVYPYTAANVERLGNGTLAYLRALLPLENDTAALPSGVWSQVLTGPDACAHARSDLGLVATPVDTPNQRSMVWPFSLYGSGALTLRYPPPAMPLMSGVPDQLARNARRGLGCGLQWRRTPQPACRVERRFSVAREPYVPSNGDPFSVAQGGTTLSLAVQVSTVEYEAAIGCDDGRTLPVPLTDRGLAPSVAADKGDRYLDVIGRPWLLGPASQWPNATTSNLCVSGMCLSTVRPDVQTVLLVVSAAPTATVVTYVSTKQGFMSITGSTFGYYGVLVSVCLVLKQTWLWAEERAAACGGQRRRRLHKLMSSSIHHIPQQQQPPLQQSPLQQSQSTTPSGAVAVWGRSGGVAC